MKRAKNAGGHADLLRGLRVLSDSETVTVGANLAAP
jgi:hypothetical protein